MPAINRKPLTLKVLRELANKETNERLAKQSKKQQNTIVEHAGKLKWEIFKRDNNENVNTTQMDYKPLESPKRLRTVGVHQSIKMKNANEPRTMFCIGKDMYKPVKDEDRIMRTIENHNKKMARNEIIEFEDEIVEVCSFNHGKTIKLVRV